MDYFGGSHARDGPLQFILYRPEKGLCIGEFIIVIAGRGVDVGNLLIEPPLRCTNIPNALEQFIEVVPAESCIG